jgi:diacylglycerol kinase (ATP)
MEEGHSALQKAIFIMNPVSGGVKTAQVMRLLDRWVDRRKYRFEVELTQYPGHAEELSRKAAAASADVVVAVGGDGTVNEVARGLVGTGVRMGIIPAGSGNGLARHLCIPANIRRAIEVINRGKTVRIDTATLNGRLFVNVAGVGFDAFVAKKFAKAPKRGFWSYFKISISEYFLYKPKKYRLVIDGQEITRRALLVSFANSSQFGNNATINPGAKLDDGLIDICIVKKIPFYRILYISTALFLGKFDKTKYIEIIKAREATLTRKRGKVIHLDGDPCKGGKTIELKTYPLSLQVVVP